MRTEREELKEWYTNLIKMYREEYAKLSDKEKNMFLQYMIIILDVKLKYSGLNNLNGN